MRRMANYLAQDGSLFIGHSESLSGLSDTYVRVGKTVYEHANKARSQQPSSSSRPGQAPRTASTAAASPSPVSTAAQAQRPKAVERKRIVVGDVCASERPTEISTVLGSCIAVCLFDRENRLGGMNHFALPNAIKCTRKVTSFGVHAMELLINNIMQLGGRRDRLQAKIFGGANVMQAAGDGGVGQRNSEFIREFLSTESIPISAEYLGGDRGMKVLFETHTGRARMKLLARSDAEDADRQLAATELSTPADPVSDITLF